MDDNYQRIDNEPKQEEEKEVPDDKLAKLMYYLSSIFKIVDYQIEERYYYYPNFYLLTKGEEETVLKLVNIFKPEIMQNLSLFLSNSDLLSPEEDHKYYELTSEILGKPLPSEVVIDNTNLKVLKVMACNESWINKYYDQPLQEYEEQKNQKPITVNVESSNKCCKLKCDCECCDPLYCCYLCGCDCCTCRDSGCSCYCCRECIGATVGIIIGILFVVGLIGYIVSLFL